MQQPAEDLSFAWPTPCLSAVTPQSHQLSQRVHSRQGHHHTHTDGGFPGPDSPKARTSVGLVQEAHGIFYTLHQMFTFELSASHL